jgi:papilin
VIVIFVPDMCAQTVDAGRCLAYVPMFYYDRITDRCLQFVYGGCGGNDNRFQTRESCEQRCRLKKLEVTGMGMKPTLRDK